MLDVETDQEILAALGIANYETPPALKWCVRQSCSPVPHPEHEALTLQQSVDDLRDAWRELRGAVLQALRTAR